MSQPIRGEAVLSPTPPRTPMGREEASSPSVPQSDSITPAHQHSSCLQVITDAITTIWTFIKEKICCCFFPLSTAQVWQRSLAGLERQIESLRTFTPTFPRELNPRTEYVPPVSIPHHTSPYLGMTNQQAWDAAAPAYRGHVTTAHEGLSAFVSRLNSIDIPPAREAEFDAMIGPVPETADSLDALMQNSSTAHFDLQYHSFLALVGSIAQRTSEVIDLGQALAKLSDEHALDFPEDLPPDALCNSSSEEASPNHGRTNRQVWDDRLPFYKSIFSAGESLCRQYTLRQAAAGAPFTSQERDQIVRSMPEYATLRNFLASSENPQIDRLHESTRRPIEFLFRTIRLEVENSDSPCYRD